MPAHNVQGVGKHHTRVHLMQVAQLTDRSQQSLQSLATLCLLLSNKIVTTTSSWSHMWSQSATRYLWLWYCPQYIVVACCYSRHLTCHSLSILILPPIPIHPYLSPSLSPEPHSRYLSLVAFLTSALEMASMHAWPWTSLSYLNHSQCLTFTSFELTPGLSSDLLRCLCL